MGKHFNRGRQYAHDNPNVSHCSPCMVLYVKFNAMQGLSNERN